MAVSRFHDLQIDPLLKVGVAVSRFQDHSLEVGVEVPKSSELTDRGCDSLEDS